LQYTGGCAHVICKYYTFLFFTFHFLYDCSGGTLGYLQKCLQYILVRFTLSDILLLPLSHSWNSFNRSHFSIFIHEYRIFPHIHPLSPLPYILPLPTGIKPQTGPVLPSYPPLLKKRQFCLR
jgi:hypothetical protein